MCTKIEKSHLHNRMVGAMGMFVFLLTIFAPFSVQAQVVIKGQVMVESSQESVIQTGGGGYQNTPRGSSFRESAVSSKEVVIWLEAKNKNLTYEATGKTDQKRVLDQVNKHFDPRLMIIRVGDKVRIRNSDPVYHNVFSLSKTKRFDVGRRSPGDYKDVTFDQPGKVDVFCDIHSDMHAVIAVVSAQTVAMQKIASGQTFRFADIPQGDYVLHLMALGNRRKNIDIQVADTKNITLPTIIVGS